MRVRTFTLLAALAVLIAASFTLLYWQKRDVRDHVTAPPVAEGVELLLPLPEPRSGLSVEEALISRKSIREYSGRPINLSDLALLLWAAQGITEYDGWYRRTAPSAGATYPLEVYVVVGEGGVLSGNGYLAAGVYKYDTLRHSLLLVKTGDVRSELWDSALRQDWVRDAPVSIVICAVYERTTRRYGERGVRYVHMEAGHAGQNIYLMAAALKLGTVAVGAFDDEAVARVVGVQRGEEPLYIFPVGVPVEPYKGSFDELFKVYTVTRGG